MIPLRHPNVIRTYAVGRAAGTLCLAMEYIDGKSLRLLLQEPNIPFRPLVSILCKAATGLFFVHQQGIVHRDVKPENILVSADLSQVKLIDFGYAARVRRHWWEPVPLRGGTEQYVAPEQRCGAIDPRSDIYSFGVMLQEVLAGRMPPGDGSVEVVIARATDPAPERRYQSMAALATDFYDAVRPLLMSNHENRNSVRCPRES